MKYVIVYFSRFGNGKKLVTHLAATLQTKGAETQLLTVSEAKPTTLPAADFYVFSAPAEAFSIQRDMKTFMKNLQGMEGKKYGIINTHGMKKSRIEKMESLLSKKNMEKKASVDFLVGKEAQSGNGLPEGWEKKIEEFAEFL